MSARYWFAVAAALALSASASASASAAPIGGDVAPACDRVCMTGLVDRYLAALVRHDPAGLPLNRDVKFTENTARLKVGSEGLWVGASEPPTGFRIYAIDVGAGQAGFYGVMKERDRPLIIALRLDRPRSDYGGRGNGSIVALRNEERMGGVVDAMCGLRRILGNSPRRDQFNAVERHSCDLPLHMRQNGDV
jgi:hypothetical protein